MNNKFLVGGIVLLVLLGGGLFLAHQNSQQVELAKTEQEKVAMMPKDGAEIEQDETLKQEMMEKKEDESMMEKDDDTMMQTDSSRYVVHSKTSLSESYDKKRVLFFYASWCPTCRPVDATLQAESSRIPSDVVVIRVNYNDPDTDEDEKDLAQKYGVTYQHTFVQIDENGSEVATWNGGSLDQILTNIK